MFRPSSEPLLLFEAGLRGMCLSLNSPVLNLEELTVGPARAAIVLHAGQYGGLRLAVAVRSVETGTLAVFAYTGDVEGFRSPQRAMDAALTFAEGMGFLFDDDLVARDGREAALSEWLAMIGESDTPPAQDEGPVPDLDLATGPDGELLLEEVAELESALDDVPLELLDEPAAVAADPPVAPTLTKFRAAAEPVPRKKAAKPKRKESAGGNALGRIALVRRKQDRGEVRPSLIMRLLSSF